MYEIHDKDKICEKKPLKADFYPIGVPKNSSFVGQAVVGTSSAPGAGLLVNTWTGDQPEHGGASILNLVILHFHLFIHHLFTYFCPPQEST